ncbi:MAG: hypothetical protein H8D97_00515 [Proteobacteria bacterium]|nr:hypothetical protein [Pseudomonadota bacterium]MBC8427350.1 hypothetical protein [Pseudomonadota bacterium]
MIYDNFDRKKYLADRKMKLTRELDDLAYYKIPRDGLDILKQSKLKIGRSGPNDRNWKIEITAPIGDVIRLLKKIDYKIAERLGRMVLERKWKKEEETMKCL